MASQETELKFRLEPRDTARLRVHPLLGAASDADRPVVERLVSTYYDTGGRTLHAAGMSLRVREGAGRRVQTVKCAAGEGVFGRGEWEVDLRPRRPEDPSFDVEAALRTPLARLLSPSAARDLHPLFQTRVTRTRRIVRRGSAEVEVSLDEGEACSGERRTGFAELELELKAGDPAILFELARAIGAAEPLRLSFVSKAERGFALLDRTPPRVFKAAPVAISSEQTAAEAFQAIGRGCLDHLTRNEAGLLHSRTPEALHQMRVALRRLRASITTFEPLVDDRRRKAVAAELKWVAGELDDGRDLDVFIRETFRPAIDGEPDRSALAEAGRLLLAAHAAAYDRACRAVASPRYRRLVLDAAAWIQAGPWTGDCGSARTRRRPVCDFAERALDRRLKVVRRRARSLKGRDAPARHRFRIAAKKLRYTTEFFAPLYETGRTGKRRRRFVATLKALQDALGALNDRATARKTAELALAGRCGRAASPRAAFVLGAMVGARAGGGRGELAAAADAFARLDGAKRFW